MEEFSLKSVGVIRKTPRLRKKKREVPMQRSAHAVLAIAQIIDPDAWSDAPPPTVAELQRRVAALAEDLEWLRVEPTTPEGEYRRIASERRQDDALLSPTHTEVSTGERQAQAIARARMALQVAQEFARMQQRRTNWPLKRAWIARKRHV